jgi:hypothetical protein
MHDTFLVVKTNGEIWITNSRADAKALSGSAVVLLMRSNTSKVQVATITGNSGSYGITSANPKDHGNKLADPQ